MYHLEASPIGRPQDNPQFYDADDAFNHAKIYVKENQHCMNCYLVTGLSAPQAVFFLWEANNTLNAILYGSWKPRDWETDWLNGKYKIKDPLRRKLPG